MRKMDCMDCHNRPSHNYQTPIVAINNAITAGKIPKELPDIKMEAVSIMDGNYPTTDTAMIKIEQQIREYYSGSYEEIYNSKPELINRAIEGIQDVYSKNVFPEMKVRWDVYPNHIGHMEFNGCFRCHNDRHATASGEVIPMRCDLCHNIIAQGSPGNMQILDKLDGSLEFDHPNDPDQMWQGNMCSDCHRDLY